MKVAIFSESPADEAALRIVIDAVLGRPTAGVEILGLRSRGYGSVKAALPAVIKQLHYNCEADGLVVVVDSDDSRVHDPERCKNDPGDCRLCSLRDLIQQVVNSLRPIEGRAALQTALGVATPAIEAWLHNDVGRHVSEPSWARAIQDGKRPYTRRSLKMDLYGALPVPLERETAVMVEQAQQACQDLQRLRNWFPQGFQSLYCDLRSW